MIAFVVKSSLLENVSQLVFIEEIVIHYTGN